VRGVVGHRGDLVQGIQDVQLGDHGSRMAVIDPSYQDAGTRWEDNRSPRDSDGGLILYVGLATRSLAALRPCDPCKHWHTPTVRAIEGAVDPHR
jgi:hypothetical protein